ATSGSISVGVNDSVVFTENSDSSTNGGTFTYTGSTTSPAASDTGLVTVDRGQIGESTLDGTGLSEILLGRDNANDTIKGYEGNDVLIGLGGNDTLDGGAGNNLLVGGAGVDTFVISDAKSTNTISDYSGVGGQQDVIDLKALFKTAPGGGNVGDYVNYNAATG